MCEREEGHNLLPRYVRRTLAFGLGFAGRITFQRITMAVSLTVNQGYVRSTRTAGATCKQSLCNHLSALSTVRKLTDYRRAYLHLAVTEIRRRLKQRAIEYKGGCCSRCGFVGCPAAYDFHHVDPTQKDFAISGTCKSFERLRPELDKTVLLCANCHRTIHDEGYEKQLEVRRADLRRLAPKIGRPPRVS